MTERERLIELICKAFSDKNNVLNGGTIRGGKSFYLSSHLADYLLANGVRLPVTCGECKNADEKAYFCNIARGNSSWGMCTYPEGYCDSGERRADNGT